MSRHAIAGDPRFFQRTGPHDLAAVAKAAGAAAPESALTLAGVAPLQVAGPEHVSFLDNRRYLAALRASQAGAVIVHPDLAAEVPASAVALTTAEPYAAWARVCALFHPEPPAHPGIHATALIEAGAAIDPGAEIGPYVVVGAGAEIGPGCRIAAGVVIGPGVVLGADCRIGALVSISHALIGSRVTIFPGARIGQDGFGFATTATGFLSVPQLGRVVIGDDVEIGANTTIDRGSAQDTVIGAGSRLDNLVQIAHNVRLGRMCVIVAQAGISGSAVLEDFVVMGGQAGMVGHIRIGAKARIGAQAGVIGNVAAGADMVGSPALPGREFFQQVATLRRLTRGRLAGGRGRKPTSDAAGKKDTD